MTLLFPKPEPRVKKKPKRINPKGKKTLEWDRIRAELKPLFEAAGITTCELRYDGCKFNNYLSFAHTRKRGPDCDLYRVVLACTPCHDKIEYNPNMEEILEAVISKRPRKVQ